MAVGSSMLATIRSVLPQWTLRSWTPATLDNHICEKWVSTFASLDMKTQRPAKRLLCACKIPKAGGRRQYREFAAGASDTASVVLFREGYSDPTFPVFTFPIFDGISVMTGSLISASIGLYRSTLSSSLVSSETSNA